MENKTHIEPFLYFFYLCRYLSMNKNFINKSNIDMYIINHTHPTNTSHKIAGVETVEIGEYIKLKHVRVLEDLSNIFERVQWELGIINIMKIIWKNYFRLIFVRTLSLSLRIFHISD